MNQRSKNRSGRGWIGLSVLGLTLLAGCASDPAAQREKHLQAGRAAVTAGNLELGIIELRNAVQADPRSTVARRELVGLYLRTNRLGSALSELNELVRRDPSQLGFRVQRAAVLMSQGNYSEAEQSLQGIVQADPGNGMAHALLGQAYAVKGQRQEAEAELRKAIELEPLRPEFSISLGSLKMAAGEVEEAGTIFREMANRNRGSLMAQTALANYYFARKMWTEAEEAVKVARALDEKAAAPAMLEVEIAAARGRVEEAERLAGEIRAQRGTDPEAASLLAGYYRQQGKPDQVVAVLERLEQAKPDYPPATIALAEARLDAGQAAAAMKLVEKLEQRGLGAEPRTILAKGRALLAFGRTAEALPYLQKAVELTPESAHALYARAAAERALGNQEQSRATLEEAQRKDPRMIGVKVGLANMAADRQDSVLAVALANQAVEEAPTSAMALTTLARATLSKGDVRGAEAKVNEALEAENNSIPALTMYVKLSLAQGRAAEAVTRLTALAAKDRGNASLQVLEGLARYGAGDLPGAQAAAERAIQSGPRVAEAHSLLGSVFFQQRDLARAKQAFAESLRINPRNMNAGLAMLAILEQEGKGEEAKKLGERMRAQDSQSPVIAHQLARLYLEYGGDPNQALALALEARTKMAGSVSVSDTVGWAYYKLGQWGPAIQELSRCASGEQASPICQYHLGLAQAEAGRPTAAAESLNKAMANPKFRWQAEARAALEKINRKLKPI